MVSAEAAAIHGAVAACRCYGDRTVSVGSSCERLCPPDVSRVGGLGE